MLHDDPRSIGNPSPNSEVMNVRNGEGEEFRRAAGHPACAIYRLSEGLALRLRRRARLGAPRRRRTTAMDGRAGIRRDLDPMSVHAWTKYCRHHGVCRVEAPGDDWGNHRRLRLHSNTLDDWLNARWFVPPVCS